MEAIHFIIMNCSFILYIFHKVIRNALISSHDLKRRFTAETSIYTCKYPEISPLFFRPPEFSLSLLHLFRGICLLLFKLDSIPSSFSFSLMFYTFVDRVAQQDSINNRERLTTCPFFSYPPCPWGSIYLQEFAAWKEKKPHDWHS